MAEQADFGPSVAIPPHTILEQRAEITAALNSARNALSEQDSRRAWYAVGKLCDLVNGGTFFYVCPGFLRVELGKFVDGLRDSYLPNHWAAIRETDLPAPQSWLQKLEQFSADLGGAKSAATPLALKDSDRQILEVLADNQGKLLTQETIEGKILQKRIPGVNVGLRTIQRRLKSLATALSPVHPAIEVVTR